MSHPSAASRRVAVALAIVLAAFLMLATQASPAHADNCQAEELVTKMVFPSDHPLYESPAGDESSDPRCVVLKGLGCDNASTPQPCAAGIARRNDVCVIDPAYPDYPRTLICLSDTVAR